VQQRRGLEINFRKIFCGCSIFDFCNSIDPERILERKLGVIAPYAASVCGQILQASRLAAGHETARVHQGTRRRRDGHDRRFLGFDCEN
jgi:hypothetical protein